MIWVSLGVLEVGKLLIDEIDDSTSDKGEYNCEVMEDYGGIVCRLMQ